MDNRTISGPDFRAQGHPRNHGHAYTVDPQTAPHNLASMMPGMRRRRQPSPRPIIHAGPLSDRTPGTVRSDTSHHRCAWRAVLAAGMECAKDLS